MRKSILVSGGKHGARGRSLIAAPLLLAGAWAVPLSAQEQGTLVGPVLDEGQEEEADPAFNKRILPLLGNKIREKGYSLPRPIGVSVIYVDGTNDVTGSDLAISLAVGDNEPSEELVELPQVTVRGLSNDAYSTQVKVDVFILPFLNVFAAAGEIQGKVDVALDIDLDELLPPIFCRFNECGVQPLDFRLNLDNTTSTFGTTLGVGGKLGNHGHGWFVAATGTHTITISSAERNDVTTTTGSARAGIRFQAREQTFVSPYVGVGYTDARATVTGVARSRTFLPDAPTFAIRYRFKTDNEYKYAAVMGANVEISRAVTIQAEFNKGKGTNRFVTSASLRF